MWLIDTDTLLNTDHALTVASRRMENAPLDGSVDGIYEVFAQGHSGDARFDLVLSTALTLLEAHHLLKAIGIALASKWPVFDLYEFWEKYDDLNGKD